jgi:RND superfamily putative drug exporter
MAKLLHKLGAYAFGNPWRIIAACLLVMGSVGFLASVYMKPTSSEISIPGTQAQKAIDRAAELFPDGGKGSGRIVFQAEDGKKIDEYKTQIAALSDEVKDVDGVAQVISPFDTDTFVADGRTIAYAQVQLDESGGATKESAFTQIDAAVETARANGLQVEVGGDLVKQTPGSILGVGEIVGVVVALVVLAMTLGSLIAAGMPIITAVLSIGISMAGLFAMSQLFTISATTPVLAVMLGLAVGIDYSLFIINKYKTYALEGYSFKQAAAKAAGTAGNAVVFAALTVVIALAALSIVDIPFMTTMGLTGAGSIAVAAAVAVTLVPALLGLAGNRVFGKKARKVVEKAQKRGVKHEEAANQKSFWFRWGRAVTSRPVPVLLAALVLIGVIALPAKDLNLGLPTDQYAAKDTTERKAYDTLTKGFGVGFNGPLTVVVEGLPKVSDQDKDAVRQAAMTEFNKQVAEKTAQQQAVFQQKAQEAVTMEQQMALQQEIAAAQAAGEQQKQQALADIETSVGQYAKLVQLKKVSDEIAKLDNVKQALPATATADGTAGIIQVIPTTAPADQKTTDLIVTLRDTSMQKDVAGNATLAVTGSTALQEDISNKLAAALPQYLAVVVGLSLILLVIAFRSIIIPIKATLGFLLSVAAMFGALVTVFQLGWFGITDAPAPIVSFVPIIAIGILFGLAMDYEFFLVSGMHEAYTHGKDAKKAVVRGFGLGSKVVTAAGVIMVSVFAGFITNHDPTVQAIGFGLAVGILVDAFIVRMTIVPAVMTLLGKSAWWLPKWLDKRLPHVAIEGEEEKR